MGRRALRRIDPALDLSRHLVALESLPRPLDAAHWFGRQAPLEVEVGSGKGLFICAAAAADPTADYIGIEILAKYARYCAARLASRGIDNARILHGDAQYFFRDWVSDGALRAVHVYFPDPWWKARHKKRRVMNESSVRLFERALAPGGTLHFWTDVEEYYHTAVELLTEHTRLAGPRPIAERLAESDLDYRTHFERRVRLADGQVFRAQFEKR